MKTFIVQWYDKEKRNWINIRSNDGLPIKLLSLSAAWMVRSYAKCAVALFEVKWRIKDSDGAIYL